MRVGGGSPHAPPEPGPSDPSFLAPLAPQTPALPFAQDSPFRGWVVQGARFDAARVRFDRRLYIDPPISRAFNNNIAIPR